MQHVDDEDRAKRQTQSVKNFIFLYMKHVFHLYI